MLWMERLRNRGVLAASMALSSVGALSGLFTGVAYAGCNGNYCNPDVSDCKRINDFINDNCCRPPTGTPKNCKQCKRYQYQCPSSNPTYSMIGGAEECGAAGIACS